LIKPLNIYWTSNGSKSNDSGPSRRGTTQPLKRRLISHFAGFSERRARLLRTANSAPAANDAVRHDSCGTRTSGLDCAVVIHSASHKAFLPAGAYFSPLLTSKALPWSDFPDATT
jgi:hypothetical protein